MSAAGGSSWRSVVFVVHALSARLCHLRLTLCDLLHLPLITKALGKPPSSRRIAFHICSRRGQWMVGKEPSKRVRLDPCPLINRRASVEPWIRTSGRAGNGARAPCISLTQSGPKERPVRGVDRCRRGRGRRETRRKRRECVSLTEALLAMMPVVGKDGMQTAIRRFKATNEHAIERRIRTGLCTLQRGASNMVVPYCEHCPLSPVCLVAGAKQPRAGWLTGREQSYQ